MTLSYSQDLTLSIPHKQAYPEEIVAVDILTLDFDSIASTQFSISWDPSIIKYDDSETVDLDFVAVGSLDSDQGNINISWFDIDGVGKDVLDGEVFLRLHFTTVGEIGDLSPLKINDDSLDIQVVKATPVPGQFEEIALVAENGSVEIIEEEDPQSTFTITETVIIDVSCFGESSGSIMLTANQDDVSYTWTGPKNFSTNTLSLENVVAGEYTLNVFSSDGDLIFSNTYTITGPTEEMMVTEILTSPSDCSQASGSAEIIVEGGTAPYEFDLANAQQFDNGEIINLVAGTYQVTITDANDCTINATFQIEQDDSFSFSLGNDIEACDGQLITLSAGEYEQYTWSTGETSQNVDISQAGDYTVTVTNAVGCLAVDTIRINYIDEVQLQIAQTDITVCPGDSIVLTVSGGVNYEWIDPTNELTDTQGSTIMVQPNENTIYTVISESECGADELEIPVALYRITATAGEDMCVPAGEPVTLNASGGDFYYWSGFEYPLNAYDIASPTAVPEDSTQYFVMIVDKNSCRTFDTVTVFIADDPAAFIPHINMITPNGDGQNDVLDFGSIEKFGSNNIRVFNRWGKIVYEKLNYQNDEERFSGIYNGKPLPAGNYYYVLSFRDNKRIKQTLTIARED